MFFKLFLYFNIKNNFLKIKKYYFNIFINKKQLQLPIKKPWTVNLYGEVRENKFSCEVFHISAKCFGVLHKTNCYVWEMCLLGFPRWFVFNSESKGSIYETGYVYAFHWLQPLIASFELQLVVQAKRKLIYVCTVIICSIIPRKRKTKEEKE
jgi:hypothetical protein